MAFKDKYNIKSDETSGEFTITDKHEVTVFVADYNDDGLVNTYQTASLPMSDLKMILAKVNTEHNRNLVDNVTSQVQESYKKPFNKNLTD